MTNLQNLFENASEEEGFKQSPLAYRMRPQTLDEFVGQDHIVGKGKLLRRLIEADQIRSLIFFGPPGTGKTSLSQIIVNMTDSHYEQLNAVESKTADVRAVFDEARTQWQHYRRKTILVIDEIHRFNKAQQDVLLKNVENGTISLIGTTTVNPIYSLNSALISRSRLFEFRPLLINDMLKVLESAIGNKRGLADYQVSIDRSLLKYLVKKCDGDLRQALNNLELAVLSTSRDKQGRTTISEDAIEQVVSRKVMAYDENEHYDLTSAFIKSMRGSNETDAVYYLARMLKAGEDPLFIARRMVIFASEDIGLADPQALTVATNVFRAVETIGLPEGQINLSHGVHYLCRAPKNRDAYNAIKKMMNRVEEVPNNPVPDHLKNWKSPTTD